MRAAIDELTVLWGARDGTGVRVPDEALVSSGRPGAAETGSPAGSAAPSAGANGAPTWHSQVFAERESSRPGRRRATRYERFTTRMVLVSSVLMFAVTAYLHVFNYGLETKTSSTSGSHGGFYKDSE